ncbi:MAG TPA: hypothetical protein VFW60_02680 [Rhodanobacteraceae bacterium]|nr:hypothetical protein [Rhodanobacteraceae bacterium]
MCRTRPPSNRLPNLRRAAILCLVAAVPYLTCGIANARDAASFAHWQVALDVGHGDPSGYVQVRENRIEGTRLDFGADLDVNHLSDEALRLAYRIDPDRSVQLVLQNYTLTGSTMLPQDVNFNGATLAADTRLRTVTRFPDFLRATLFYQRTLSRFANWGSLSGRAGFTFEGLTFRLDGTLTPDSVGREMKEDFVSQELPVPMIGVQLDEPLSNRLAFVASLDGAWLPRVNSLRKEGGEVTLAQTNMDATLGLDYELTRRLGLTGGYRFGYFKQDERSHEDGNHILLKSNSIELGLTYAF